MGGGSRTTTQVIQPTPPPQPSTAEGIREFVGSLPQLFQAQLEFAPKEAQQQVELAQQFALPLAQTFQQAQAELFPTTTQLQETLAEDALQRLQGGVPQSQREQFLSDFRANLGTNVGSPIGAEATARSLLALDEEFKRNARDLALSVAGRQPLSQPVSPQFTNQLGQFSPGQALQFQAQNFGTFSQASRPLLGQTSQGPGFEGFANLGQGLSGVGSFLFG